MFLRKLSVVQFKNYQSAEFEFTKKINCFVGNNGVGKTNLLDAIFYLSFCKSNFNLSDVQNIKDEEKFFAIHGTYGGVEEEPTLLSCVQKRNARKVFKYNKKEYDRLADHIGLFPLVMISPYDHTLIESGSEVRRKYFDSVISQLDRGYLDSLIQYNRILQQRNALLKLFAEQGRTDLATLDVFDERLAEFGMQIFHKRLHFMTDFREVFSHYFAAVSCGREKAAIDYNSQMNNGEMLTLLKANRSNDLSAHYSTTGIHKDDFGFLLNGMPLKRMGSQGQQKSFLVSLKLAQFEYTKKVKERNPLLLLDDVFDKLDNARVERLVQLVASENFGQVFITDTQRERLEEILSRNNINYQIFEIADHE